MSDQADIYDRDFHAWAMEQAALLRAGRLSEADTRHIAEEIEALADAYGDAVLRAERETDLPREVFPWACPYSFEQAIDVEFWPEAA